MIRGFPNSAVHKLPDESKVKSIGELNEHGELYDFP
jgi:hypothetical protein